MGDSRQILKRIDQMKTRRALVENAWRACFNYTYPLRGVGFNSLNTPIEFGLASANAKQAELYDTTATNSVRLLASTLLGGMTPANSQWVGADVFDATDDEKAWLQEAAHLVWLNIHASNYTGHAFECFMDSVIAGQFALFVDEGKEEPFRFEQWPLSQCYFACSQPGGRVDIIAREFQLSAQQAFNAYGDKVCKQIVEALDKNPDKLFPFIQLVEPRPNPKQLELPISSTHICMTSKEVVRDSGYKAHPVIVPRLLCLPGSAYAQGLVYDALPTIKSLNKLTEIMLGTGDMAMAGMWGAVDDGILNPKTVTIGPRRIITMASRDSMFPLSPGSNFQIGQWMIENMQAQVRKALLSDDLINKNGNSYMTATEVNARVSAVRQMLGPNYERFQDEFLRPLFFRCFTICWEKGIFKDPPPSLANKIMRVTYSTPLAKAQKAEDVQAMVSYESLLAQEAQVKPEVLDLYDWDMAARLKADMTGINVRLMKNSKIVAQEREQRAKAQQEALKQQQIAEAAKQGDEAMEAFSG